MLQRLINIFNNLQPRQLLILAGVAAALMIIMISIGIGFLTKNTGIETVTEPAEEKPPIQMEKVVVAKVNIQPRTRIQENMLQIKELPVDMVPEGAIRSLDEVKDVQVQIAIFAGDVLTLQKVLAESKDEGFTGSIPADCRAISINVNDVTGVAGFAKPGDHVDLLLVEKGKYSATANVLLQNVLLLSINQNTLASAPMENGVPSSAAISNPSIATFALHPSDVLRLISASKLGEIYMSLRPAKPQATYVDTAPYTIESIDAPPPKTEQPAPTNPAPTTAPVQQSAEPPVPKIEIIQGDKIVQNADTPTAPSQVPAVPSNPTATPPANN